MLIEYEGEKNPSFSRFSVKAASINDNTLSLKELKTQDNLCYSTSSFMFDVVHLV